MYIDELALRLVLRTQYVLLDLEKKNPGEMVYVSLEGENLILITESGSSYEIGVYFANSSNLQNK